MWLQCCHTATHCRRGMISISGDRPAGHYRFDSLVATEADKQVREYGMMTLVTQHKQNFDFSRDQDR